MNLGVLFAISEDESEHLRGLESSDECGTFISEELEERYFEEHRHWVGETDKAWDAMHRLLANGKLEYEGGDFPLSHTILGGEQLCQDGDYTCALKTSAEVSEIAKALSEIDKDALRELYFSKLSRSSYGSEYGEDDFEYTWSNFTDVVKFYQRASQDLRFVIFTVDS